MLSRTPLALLEHGFRTPLKLLQEIDQRLRELERSAAESPGDTELQKNRGRHRRRAGPPDREHNWRFNGKGWFTRPQWNGGRCPPDSQPTRHNTCIGDNDKDKQHYKDVGPPTKIDPSREIQRGASPERVQAQQARAARGEMVRTPGVVNSPFIMRPGNKVNWEHPHEPKIYQPYENDKPRPLPDSPEHLGGAFSGAGSSRAGSWRHREHVNEMDRISKHYTDKGFDPKYVKNVMSPTRGASSIDWDSLSDADLERLPPDRMSRVRALRKKGVKDQAAREAEYAAERQAFIDQYGEPPYEGYEDYDDYGYDDYDDHDREEQPAVIGGYRNHPGYPGHPDYPEFDGRPAEIEREHRRSRENREGRSPWRRNTDRHAYRPEPDDSDREFAGPHGQPPWPRTGERGSLHDPESEEYHSTSGGRERGSSRTSYRSYMGGGRGRTNFRRRGGPRR